MILDPDNQYIQAINSHVPLGDKAVLEIGCGNGRMTRDISGYAARTVATEANKDLLDQATEALRDHNITLIHTPSGTPSLPEKSFDVVIYTLSLHHIPEIAMQSNLLHSGDLLKKGGKIVVVEPGEMGTFLEIKREFNAGSGDESEEKAAALAAMKSLPGWSLTLEHRFEVDFHFDDVDDFLVHKLPGYQELPQARREALSRVLARHKTQGGIRLGSERVLYRLERDE